MLSARIASLSSEIYYVGEKWTIVNVIRFLGCEKLQRNGHLILHEIGCVYGRSKKWTLGLIVVYSGFRKTHTRLLFLVFFS